jgi:hypothetical protein
LREQVRAIGLEPRKPTPQSELLNGTFEERRAKAKAKLDEEIAKATATADPVPVGDPVPCPVCGAEHADVGYRGHGSNCPRFYRAS